MCDDRQCERKGLVLRALHLKGLLCGLPFGELLPQFVLDQPLLFHGILACGKGGMLDGQLHFECCYVLAQDAILFEELGYEVCRFLHHRHPFAS